MDELYEGATSNSITLTWTKPEGDVSGYRIDYTPVTEGGSDGQKKKKKESTNNKGDKEAEDKDENLKSMTVDADTTKMEVTGLDGGQEYKIVIVSVSGEEESEVVAMQEKTSEWWIFLFLLQSITDFFSLMIF